MSEKIKILELFGGIGACSKAIERQGIDYEIADYVEIDKYAVKSFNAIHGTNFEPQDISKWDKDIEVDLIMHGSPCQDFSSAGKQAGGDKGSGTRSSLMYETLRIVEKLKPKYVIWENVKNLLSKTHRHNFDAYQQQMEMLGYENHYQVLNAKDYGVPQNRERVFTVSIRKDLQQKFNFPEKMELTKRLKDILESEVDEKFYLSDKQIHGMTVTKFNQYRLEKLLKSEDGTADTIKARFDGCPQCIAASRGREENGATEQHLEPRDDDCTNTITSVSKDNYVVESATKEVCNQAIEKGLVEPYDSIEVTFANARLKEMENGWIKKQNRADNSIMSTLKTTPQALGICVREANKKGYAVAEEGDSINTQQPHSTTRRGRVGKGVANTLQTSDTMAVVDNLQIRKLTPKECWRLMGFDDADFDKAQIVNSNSQLYKQAGNSIVVNVLEGIVRNLLKES